MSTSVDEHVDELRITPRALWMPALRAPAVPSESGAFAGRRHRRTDRRLHRRNRCVCGTPVTPIGVCARYVVGVPKSASPEGGTSPLDAARIGVDVEVRRSLRRRRTVSAYRDGARIIVLMPARFTRAEEQKWVREMVGRITTREQVASTRGPRRSDASLHARAVELVNTYLDADAYPTSVRWVDTMRTRWASCTLEDSTIRISSRLRSMPAWVLDYVLVHELAHLREPGHGPQFWALVERYPRTERARGYLDGISAAAQLPIEPGIDVEPGEAVS
jgi:predicted metal-dependent hydrolase